MPTLRTRSSATASKPITSPSATPSKARGTKRTTATSDETTSPAKPVRGAKKLKTEAAEAQVKRETSTKTNGKTATVKKQSTAVIKPEAVDDEPHVCDHGDDESESSELSELEDDEEDEDEGVKPKKKKAAVKAKAKVEAAAPKKRKTKEEKDAEMLPLAARSKGLRMLVGAHVSGAKGIENSITNSMHIGGNAFALFLKSQRKWDNPPLKDENRDAFRKACDEHKYDAASHILPHGSYLVNLAQEDPDKAKQAYTSFLDDLKRCEALGIKLYNFHPGATGTSPLPDALARISKHLTNALEATNTVIPVLETMCGSGTVIGSRLSDLSTIISHIPTHLRSRIGICIDTCHVFAAGHDLRSPDTFKQYLADFDAQVGLQYLKALHINDSKVELGTKRDLHANIGTGFLGLRAFWNVMNEPRFEGLPLILETPIDRPDPNPKPAKAGATPKGLQVTKTIEDKSVWATEIKLLESLIGMDPESEEFLRLETRLAKEGEAEREKFAAQTRKKEDAVARKAQREAEKGQKSLKDMFGGKGKGKGMKKSVAKGRNRKADSEEEDEIVGDESE